MLIKIIECNNKKEGNKLWGVVFEIQCDETTVHERKKLFSDNIDWKVSKPKWLLVLIDQNDFWNFKLFLLPDWKKETLMNLFISNVVEWTLIKTDGHPSYLDAVQAANCGHKVVNHSEVIRAKMVIIQTLLKICGVALKARLQIATVWVVLIWDFLKNGSEKKEDPNQNKEKFC